MNYIDPSTVECSRCGKNGLPQPQCSLCHGNSEVVPRQYTLSEERLGRAPKSDRYDEDGGIPFKIINLPGSAGPNTKKSDNTEN